MTTGDTILPSQHNPPLNDIASSITNSLSRQGYGGMLAVLDMGGFKVQNAAQGTVGTDLARLDQTISTDGGAITGNLTIGGTLGVTGNIRGPNFVINAMATSDAGTFGFTNSNGPGMIFWGSASAGVGLFELKTAGTTRLSISAAGDVTISTGALIAKDQVAFSGLANFLLSTNSGAPLLSWDSNDYIGYDRSGNIMSFVIGGATKLTVDAIGPKDGTGVELGYKDCPQNAQSGAYTLVLADRGKDLYLTSSGALTIPPNSSVAFPLGTTIAFTNDGSARTLTQGVGVTIKWAGSGTTGNRTLGSGSMGAIKKVGTDTWYVSGAGVS